VHLAPALVGTPVPAWYGPDGAVFVAETRREVRREASANYGEAVALRREDDVQTPGSPALWPFSTLGWPGETPSFPRIIQPTRSSPA